MNYYQREEDPEPILSQLVRRATIGNLARVDTLPSLQNTRWPSGRLLFRGYTWERDETDDRILRIFDLMVNMHSSEAEAQLFLVDKPNSDIVFFDQTRDDLVVGVPRTHRYAEDFVLEFLTLKHKDDRRVGNDYVEQNLRYSAQQPIDFESEYSQVILCDELNLKDVHPIIALLQNASKNPTFKGIDFLGSLHKPDLPDSPNYPDYNRQKYFCNFYWNCPICCFHDYTIRKFRELQERGRQTTTFRKGIPADSEENWNIDKAAQLRQIVDTIEISNLTLMTVAMAADQDRIMKLKDPKLLEIELERLRELKEQLATNNNVNS